MADNDDQVRLEFEKDKLELEKYKALLDYRKFWWGSVFAAITIATIPPSFQLATALLEHVRTQAQAQTDQNNKEAEARTQQQRFRDEYIKEFLSRGIDQDIELRIRFALYFSHVSDEKYRKQWVNYHQALKGDRDRIRKDISTWELDWQQKAQARPRDDAELDRIARNLTWAYKEVGYAERNRSVAQDPRTPSTPVQASSAQAADATSAQAKYLIGDSTPAFFDKIKSSIFKDGLSSSQISSIDAIIGYWRTKYKSSDTRMLAYMLATTYHETGKTMLPIEEYGKGRGTLYATPAENGKVYYGRGFIGLVWAANYKKMGDILGVDLYNNPDLALDQNISAAILIEGMMRGAFSGKKLSDFFDGDRTDWINARRVVNGLDNARIIAEYAERFFQALQAT
jgi:hypothetical protein